MKKNKMSRTAVLMLLLQGCLLLMAFATLFGVVTPVSALPEGRDATPVHQTPGIITLNDENFEHSTQASTGQTTGSWLVWFHTSNDNTYIEAAVDKDQDGNVVSIIPTPDVWAERCHAVLAAVNVDEGGMETMKRFQIQPEQLPSFVYFHKGKLYRYPNKATVASESPYRWDDLLTFCQDPAAVVTNAEDIPAPPSVWEHLRTKVKNDTSLMLLLGGMVMVVVLGLLVKAILGAAAVKAPSQKDKSKAA